MTSISFSDSSLQGQSSSLGHSSNNSSTETPCLARYPAQQDSLPKKKKTLKRKLASCSGCRRRRTRCDRILPCSECVRRNSSCDYEGASVPSIAARRNFGDEALREEYIQTLEVRLRQLEQALHHSASCRPPSPPQEPLPELDFAVDDLAANLSTITLGQRPRCSRAPQRPHPLQVQIESIISAPSTPAPACYIQPEQAFSLNLVTRSQIPPLAKLCHDLLPTRAQVEVLSGLYFQTLNVWSPSIHHKDWKIQLDKFWSSPDRLQFRPPPLSSDPPHQTVHRLAQFVATIYALVAHGLLRHADIHHLESVSEQRPKANVNASPPGPSQSGESEFWNKSQAEHIALAGEWFRYSLGLLVGDEGQIFIKPTVFGIRAMAVLSNVELAPENLDHGIFFWSLTTNLAATTGLFNEPPLAHEEEVECLDETELESRRQLAWSMLGLDWAGHTISGGLRQRSDPDQYFVKIPGTVASSAIAFHPVDGWPLDPLICVHRASALSDRVMQKTSIKILLGQPATYNDVLAMEKQIDEVEKLIPERFQAVMSADGQSIYPKIKADALHTLLAAFLCSRFSISRVRLHRLFISPKPGVSEEERQRHLKIVLHVSRRHFLAISLCPHNLIMHPLMLYGLVNTAVACALVLLTERELHKSMPDLDFFIPQFNKLIGLFDLGKKTIASSMARKAVTLLQTLIKKIEEREDEEGAMAADRRKKGPGAATSRAGGEAGGERDEPRRKVAQPWAQGSQRVPVGPGQVKGSLGEARNPVGQAMYLPTQPMTGPSGLYSQPTTLYQAPQADPRGSRAEATYARRPVARLPMRTHALEPATFGTTCDQSENTKFVFSQPLTPPMVTSPAMGGVPMAAAGVGRSAGEYSLGERSYSSMDMLLASSRLCMSPTAGLGIGIAPTAGRPGFSAEDSHVLSVFEPDFLSQIGMAGVGGEGCRGGGGRGEAGVNANPFQPRFQIGWSPGVSVASASPPTVPGRENFGWNEDRGAAAGGQQSHEFKRRGTREQ